MFINLRLIACLPCIRMNSKIKTDRASFVVLCGWRLHLFAIEEKEHQEIQSKSRKRLKRPSTKIIMVRHLLMIKRFYFQRWRDRKLQENCSSLQDKPAIPRVWGCWTINLKLICFVTAEQWTELQYFLWSNLLYYWYAIACWYFHSLKSK